MNRHLSSEQMAACLLGDITPVEVSHACDCAECRAELSGLEQSVAQFRQAVRSWSEHQDPGVPVRTSWGVSRLFFVSAFHNSLLNSAGRATKAGVGSVLIHAAAFATILMFGSSPVITHNFKAITTELLVYVPRIQPERSSGGGGGDASERIPARRGNLPKPAPRQFTPPRVDPVEARLVVPPSLTIPAILPSFR